MKRFRYVIAVVAASLFCNAPAAKACSVCFGDPDSEMTKGAFAGVLVLAAIIGGVLLWITGTGIYWVQRARRLAALNCDTQ